MYTSDEQSSVRRALMLGMPALLLAGCAGVQRHSESAADGFTEGPDAKGRESAHTRKARAQMRRNLPNILLYTQDGKPARPVGRRVTNRRSRARGRRARHRLTRI